MKQKETEKQSISGELALLRSQINPRFLLNTLTYIKSLVGTMPEKAIYSIENLSEIMSYMLYETSDERVPLEAEINYMRNYLKLQEVRYSPGYVVFEVSGETCGLMVPPLLFMPFLENTFSTAQEDSPERPGISITLLINGNSLIFSVTNYTSDRSEGLKDEKAVNLRSIKRFLDLEFGNNYTLDTMEENDKSILRLNVKLS